MKKACLILLAYCVSAFGQAPEVLWNKTYGILNEPREGTCIIQTLDGNLLLAGNGDLDTSGTVPYFIKVDPNGEIIWSTYFTAGTYESKVYSIIQLADGDFVAAGYIHEDDYITTRAVLIVISNDGQILFSFKFGQDGERACARSLLLEDSGNIVFTGNLNNDMCFVRCDVRGHLILAKTYDTYYWATGTDIKPTPDSGYISVGMLGTDDYGVSYGIRKVNHDGDEIWAWCIGSLSPTIHYQANAVIVAPDSGYIAIGGYGSVARAFKYGSESGPIWFQMYSELTLASDIMPAIDGGYIIAGYSAPYLQLQLGQLIKIDEAGQIVWQRTVSSPDSGYMYGSAVRTDDGSIYALGTAISADLYFKGFLLTKFGPEQVAIDPDPNEFKGSPFLCSNYPNPFNAQTIIRYILPRACDVELNIYDLLGQKVGALMSGYQAAGEHNVTWNASGVPSGVYFYKIKAGNSNDIRKCLLLK